MMILGYPFKSPYPLTSPFGIRNNPFTGEKKQHNGCDYGVPEYTHIISVADGVIIKSGWQANPRTKENFMSIGFGLRVWQRIKLGGTPYDVFYAHCSAVTAMAGQKVLKGSVLALSGNTGRSTGAHLHIGVRHAITYKWVEAAFLSCKH